MHTRLHAPNKCDEAIEEILRQNPGISQNELAMKNLVNYSERYTITRLRKLILNGIVCCEKKGNRFVIRLVEGCEA